LKRAAPPSNPTNPIITNPAQPIFAKSRQLEIFPFEFDFAKGGARTKAPRLLYGINNRQRKK
jgi:hypothetical protein